MRCWSCFTPVGQVLYLLLLYVFFYPFSFTLSFPFPPEGLDSPSFSLLCHFSEQKITNRLIDVYFAKSHAASGMIHQSRFLTSMTLPPKHVGFPHLSLLHAMLATASRIVSASFFEGEEQYWRKLGGEGKGVSEYHSVQSRVSNLSSQLGDIQYNQQVGADNLACDVGCRAQ